MGAIDFEIQLDVVAGRSQAEPAHCEIRASEYGVFHAGVVDVIHFSVQESGLGDGANFDFLLNPIRAFTRNALLFELVL